MAELSAIEWTDATWNPWQGCTKVSPACANCYMFRDMKRYGRDGAIVVRSKPPTFNLPLKRNKQGEFALKPGTKVFTCSWSDWFHEAADAWRPDAWKIIRSRQDLTFQIVTKRTERIADHLPDDWGEGYQNVWMIATAENQQWLTARMNDLAKIPCKIRGLSVEPMLGPMVLNGSKIDWVIVGGESGPGSRPMHPGWVRNLREECRENQIPFFFKQWGEWLPDGHGGKVGSRDNGPNMLTIGIDGRPKFPGDLNLPEFGFVTFSRVGKQGAGRLLDGREYNEFPV
jgi:protein gp37